MIYYYDRRCGAADTVIKIVLLLSQGVLLMKDCQKAMMATGVANIPGFDDLLQEIDEIDAYIADIIEEELHDRF